MDEWVSSDQDTELWQAKLVDKQVALLTFCLWCIKLVDQDQDLALNGSARHDTLIH